jgi:hypothetical protein
MATGLTMPFTHFYLSPTAWISGRQMGLQKELCERWSKVGIDSWMRHFQGGSQEQNASELRLDSFTLQVTSRRGWNLRFEAPAKLHYTLRKVPIRKGCN